MDERLVDSGLVLIRIVDRCLGSRAKLQKCVLPSRDLLSQTAFGHGQRCLALGFGLSLDEIRQAFGLSQVDPAILKGAAGELSRLRGPEYPDVPQCTEDGINYGTAAVTVELDRVLPSRTCRRVEAQDQCIVQDLPKPVPQGSNGSAASDRKRTSERYSCRMRLGSADADDADGRWGAAAG
jgi:hypothetical protein